MSEDITRLKIAVIGAGPAGISAAVSAARQNASVTLFEKNAYIGRKLLMTGNGRCNLTNELVKSDSVSQYYSGSAAALIDTLFSHYGYNETEKFFGEIGITYRKRDTLIYPYSDQAVSVQKAFLLELNRLKADIRYGTKVTAIDKAANGYTLTIGQLLDGSMEKEHFDRVILAPGSRCMPDTGSDNFAYKLLKKLSIEYEKPLPSLTKLKCNMGYMSEAAGDRWQGKLSLYADGILADSEYGEIQFLKDSISGIVAFQLSGAAARFISQGKSAAVEIDLFPAAELSELKELLKDRFKSLSDRSIEDALCGLLKERLIGACLLQAGIDGKALAADISEQEIERFSMLLKKLTLTVIDTGGFNECQTCSGGIKISELTERLEIKRHPGMFAAGEIIDADGKCGGFNIQFAISSGMLAGEQAAGK